MALTTELRRKSLRPALFQYQEELVGQARQVIREGGRGLLALPTGAGKTRTAVVAILEEMTPAMRIIWLAPTIELLDQAGETFSRMWRELPSAPDLVLARGTAPEPGPNPTVWLSTPQAVFQALQRGDNMGRWDLVVFDEAHQAEAPTFKEALSNILSQGTSLLGLSATPGRASAPETLSLTETFKDRLLTSPSLGDDPVSKLQTEGVLARLRFRMVTRKIVPPAQEADRIRIAARATRELAKRGRRVLVFTQSVAGAYALAEVLNHEGVNAAAVDSQLDPLERASRLRFFEEGRLSVIANQRVLATGYDCPAVSDCLLLSPVRSPILFEQMVGRAARGPRTGGWSDANVWQFDDHLAMHGLPSSYYRFNEWRV